MAVRESVEIDLDRVDRLIQEQEAELEPKHRASIAYREIARRHVAGGVASSWQASPPHAIFIERGDGSRIWDIDGNEYVDYHLGYGAMVVGHAHPAVVEAIERQVRNGTHFAQPTKHLDAIGANLAERFSLPLWRFCNSGTEATLEAARLMRAKTGRDLLIKIEGTYHGHHDSLMFSVIPDPELMGPRDHPVTMPQAPGIPQAFADLVVVVPFNDLAAVRQAFEEHPRRGGRHDRRTRDDELRRHPARARLPPGARGPLPRVRRVPRVRRGEDRRGTRRRRRGRGVRRRARHRVPRQGDRRRHPVRRGRRDRGAVRARGRRRVRHGGDVQREPAHDGGDARDPHRGADGGRVPHAEPPRRLPAGAALVRDRAVPAAGVRHRRGGQGVRDLFDPAGARVPRFDRHRRAHHLPRVAVPAERRRVQVAVGQAGDVDAFGPAFGRGRATLRRQRRGVRAGGHLLRRDRGCG